MSSATSEERREAATNLRKIHLGGANKDLMELTLSDAVGAWHENGMSWDYITERLADLIDPTCHMVDTDHEYEDSIRCDVCQMTFNRPWEPFKFCPNCGARVV